MKLVVLDRDGVINHDSPDYIKSADEWRPIEGSLEAIFRLNQAGFRVSIATNQAGIGRGLFDYGALLDIHSRLNRELQALGGRVDGIFFCPHAPEADCECRKPRPGLLQAISERFQIRPEKFSFVGDSMRDIAAAQAIGAIPVLLRTGNGRKTEIQHTDELENVAKFDNLAAYVDDLLGK